MAINFSTKQLTLSRQHVTATGNNLYVNGLLVGSGTYATITALTETGILLNNEINVLSGYDSLNYLNKIITIPQSIQSEVSFASDTFHSGNITVNDPYSSIYIYQDSLESIPTTGYLIIDGSFITHYYSSGDVNINSYQGIDMRNLTMFLENSDDRITLDAKRLILSGNWMVEGVGVNPNSIVVQSGLWATGQQIYNIITGLSGQNFIDYATKIQLTQTGIDLISIINSISGVLQTIVNQTGQQAWNAANNNGINLSGNLYQSGNNLYRLITGSSGQFNTNFATKIDLTTTGQTLDNKINSLSGFTINSSGGLEFRISQTGAATILYSNGIGINLTGRLIETGSLLSAVHVTGSNTLNNPNFTGIGSIIVIRSGEFVLISGSSAGAGDVTQSQLNSLSGYGESIYVHRTGNELISGNKNFQRIEINDLYPVYLGNKNSFVEQNNNTFTILGSTNSGYMSGIGTTIVGFNNTYYPYTGGSLSDDSVLLVGNNLHYASTGGVNSFVSLIGRLNSFIAESGNTNNSWSIFGRSNTVHIKSGFANATNTIFGDNNNFQINTGTNNSSSTIFGRFNNLNLIKSNLSLHNTIFGYSNILNITGGLSCNSNTIFGNNNDIQLPISNGGNTVIGKDNILSGTNNSIIIGHELFITSSSGLVLGIDNQYLEMTPATSGALFNNLKVGIGASNSNYDLYVNGSTCLSGFSMLLGNCVLSGYLSGRNIVASTNSNYLPTPPSDLGETIIHVGAQNSNGAQMTIDSFGGIPSLVLRRAQGTNASKTNIEAGNAFGAIFGYGYGSSAYISEPSAAIRFRSPQNWTDSSRPGDIYLYSKPTGSTLPIYNVARFSSSGVNIAPSLSVGIEPVLGIEFTKLPDATLHVSGSVRLDGISTSTTANVGAATLPANPVGFITINITGGNFKIPYYNI